MPFSHSVSGSELFSSFLLFLYLFPIMFSSSPSSLPSDPLFPPPYAQCVCYSLANEVSSRPRCRIHKLPLSGCLSSLSMSVSVLVCLRICLRVFVVVTKAPIYLTGKRDHVARPPSGPLKGLYNWINAPRKCTLNYTVTLITTNTTTAIFATANTTTNTATATPPLPTPPPLPALLPL